MTCKEWNERLDEGLDEQLEPSQAARWQQHVLECPTCAAQLRFYRQMRAACLSCGEEQPPAELASRTLDALRFQQASRRRAEKKRAVAALASLAAVLALTVSSGLLWLNGQSGKDLLTPSELGGEQKNADSFYSEAQEPCCERADSNGQLPPASDALVSTSDLLAPGSLYPFIVRVTCPPEEAEAAAERLFLRLDALRTGGGWMIPASQLDLFYERVRAEALLVCDYAVSASMASGDVLIVLIAP